MFPVFSLTKILDTIILMHLVKEGPLHGYALTAEIEKNTGWKPSQTAVYNSLKSMEAEELVASQEKIESGRVQKQYTITKKGKEFFDNKNYRMKEQMKKNLVRFFSFAQMVSELDTDNAKNTENLQEIIQLSMKSMKEISQIVFILLKEAPRETQIVIEASLTSLKKIAAENDIELPEIKFPDD
jgi:DNA-binding PadR family transcriptional regulator